MENEFLDSILKEILQKDAPYIEEYEQGFSTEIVITKLRPAIQFLHENNYLKTYSWGSLQRIEVTPKGKKFISEGGFAQAAKEKNELLLYSKESRDYAKKAYYVAILGILIACIIFILSKR